VERVDFRLGPSLMLTILYSLVFLGVFLIIFFLPFPLWGQCLFIFCLSVYGYSIFKDHILRRAENAVINIWQNRKGQWGFETNNGDKGIGSLAGDSYMSRFFVVLRICTKYKIKSVIIPRDAVTARAYQLLCARICFFTQY
jgi:hypothetical protein